MSSLIVSITINGVVLVLIGNIITEGSAKFSIGLVWLAKIFIWGFFIAIIGAGLIAMNKRKIGAIVAMVGSLLAFPFGLVGVSGAYRIYRESMKNSDNERR
jgi:hypothetical protein